METDEILDDSQLLCRMRDGDHQAFEQLYHRYKRRIVVHLITLFKDGDLAQDIAQETFIKVWENRERLDERKSFKAYLFTIATNHVYSLMQRISRDEQARLSFRLLVQGVTEHVDEYIAKKEHAELLDTLLNRLPERQRQVFRLFKIDGYSYTEISARLNISHNTINTHIKRTNAYLRELLLRRPDLLLALVIAQSIQNFIPDY